MAGEARLQTKILEWLKANGFYAIKTIVCNVNGVADILACSPKGRFVAVEVKYGDNKASKLQLFNINQVNDRGGIAFVAWDLETVIHNLQGELK